MNKTTILAIGATFVVTLLVITALEVEAKPPQATQSGSSAIAIRNELAPDGEIICADSSVHVIQLVNFIEYLNDNSLAAGFTLHKSGGGDIAMFLTSLKLTDNEFVLNGYVNFDTLCNEIKTVKAELSGSCGLNQLLAFSDDLGRTGTFTANVACVPP